MRTYLILLALSVVLSKAAFAEDVKSVSRSFHNLTASSVVNGNTVSLSNAERVVLLGVRRPEAYRDLGNQLTAKKLGLDPKHYGSFADKATEFLKELVERKEVLIRFDEALLPVNFENDFGRKLVYLELLDGTLVNEALIREGLATVDEKFFFDELHNFKIAQRQAKENKKGIWNDESVDQVDT